MFSIDAFSQQNVPEDIYARGTETPVPVHDAGVRSNTEHWNVTERWNSKGSKHRKFTIPITQKRPCSMQILLNIFVISFSGSSKTYITPGLSNAQS